MWPLMPCTRPDFDGALFNFNLKKTESHGSPPNVMLNRLL